MNKREELKAMCGAVDELAAKMKKKLRAKAREGYSGGLKDVYRRSVSSKLHQHSWRLTEEFEGAKQAVDVCNLAMMLWVLGGKP